MTLHRFFTDEPLVAGSTGRLSEQQSRQIASVLRMRVGDRLMLFDGSGVEADAVITTMTKRAVEFEVRGVARPEREPALDLTVGLALLRGDRFELAVQKLTEVGVRRIVPLTAERCVVSFPDARDWEKRATRYRRIIVEALEQSERVLDVELTEPTTLGAFLERQSTLALVERGDHPTVAAVPIDPVMAVAFGPEGGWSPAELDLIDQHATTASLGRLILRAETAAIVTAGTLIQRSYLTND